MTRPYAPVTNSAPVHRRRPSGNRQHILRAGPSSGLGKSQSRVQYRLRLWAVPKFTTTVVNAKKLPEASLKVGSASPSSCAAGGRSLLRRRFTRCRRWDACCNRITCRLNAGVFRQIGDDVVASRAAFRVLPAGQGICPAREAVLIAPKSPLASSLPPPVWRNLRNPGDWSACNGRA